MGRMQAVYYGQTLRNLQIPISYPIQTSPFCRAIQTAQLAFGSMGIQIDPFWFEVYRLSRNLSSAEQSRVLDHLKLKLEVKPPLSSNRVIIAHSFPERVGLGQVPDMGTVIIRPLGQGNGYEIVSKLSLADLAGLPRY